MWWKQAVEAKRRVPVFGDLVWINGKYYLWTGRMWTTGLTGARVNLKQKNERRRKHGKREETKN